ncbi:MAG: GNAT family N-acetyltransferase [Candidatus Hodarchaeota archaeon]
MEEIDRSKIKIRNYRKSDYEETLALMEEMAENFSIYFNKKKWNESSGLRLFQPGYSRTTLIAEIEGTGVVGMGFIELQKSPDGLNIGFLSNWGIKKEFRGYSIGKLLAEKAIKMLTKMKADLVRIRIAMHPEKIKEHVLKLVKHIGFEPIYITVEKKINGAGKGEEKPNYSF